jgi:hypothetical protein
MDDNMKISVSDLSVGDWVCAKMAKWDYDDIDITPPMQVVRIDDKEVVLSLRWVEHCAFVDDLRPIEITADVLEKNGFVDNGVGQHYLECGNGITVRVRRSRLFRNGCWSVAADKPVGETISTTCVLFNAKHIHELQRVLRLAKTNKQIML